MINDMMAREIAAQPGILQQCIDPLADVIRPIARPVGRIFAGGCGDSAFAPAALHGVFAALGINIEPKTSMELAAFVAFRRDDTVILASISGATKRTVEAALVARDKGARVIALTCNRGSALDLAADNTVVLPFTPLSRRTPHTLDYTVTLLALLQLGLHWCGLPPTEAGAVVTSISALLSETENQATGIAAKMEPDGKIIILGAGPDLGTAQYGAAKFHEAGGLVAIAAETEQFVHGMNFILESKDTLLVLASNATGQRRGAQIVNGFRDMVAQSDLIGKPADGSWQGGFLSMLRDTIFLQQLCLATAERRCLPVEQPRAGTENGRLHADIQSRLMDEI